MGPGTREVRRRRLGRVSNPHLLKVHMARRKKVDASAPAAENDVPVAGPGHNSGDEGKTEQPKPAEKTGLTDEQKQVLWFQAKKQILALKATIASETGKLRNVFKTLKADLGLTRADVDFAISLDNDEDDKALTTHRRRMELARWEGHPIGTQPDLFDGVDRTPAVDKAKARGKKDGLAGNPCDPQADPSTPQYGAYMEAFHEGNAELARSGIKPPPAPTAPGQLEAFATEGLPPADGAEPAVAAEEEQPDEE
jgi:hypothetical protein